jgi:hypothetical protein
MENRENFWNIGHLSLYGKLENIFKALNFFNYEDGP